jgi:predicted nucleic acid-binding protein
VLPAFFRLLESAPCLGKRLHDAHLAATAVTHRVGGILTLNETDFAPFHAYVRTFSPGDALSLLSGG